MNLENFRNYCLSKPCVTEDLPFDSDTLCMKIASKIFAIASIGSFESINLKCDPDLAIELRSSYACVVPGYHMNKKHWNTILIDGEMSDPEIKKWIDHSYDLVFDSLPKKTKDALAGEFKREV